MYNSIHQVYHDLAQSRNSNIKQTLAYSLHEVAQILDNEQLVEEELIPVFEDMIQVKIKIFVSIFVGSCFLQDVEAVQMGVIKHLALFLKKLPELCRVSYLPILHDILHSTNPFNWRLRQHLAIQLPDLVGLPPKFDSFRTMFPTVMTLLQDPVVSVRRETFKGVSSLVCAVYEVTLNEKKLYSEEQIEANRQHLEELIKAINSFVVSNKCQMRQLWLELCLQLLKDLPKDLFEAQFISGILSLVCDRVANVRLALAALLVGWSPEFVAPWECSSDSSNPWLWLLKRADIKNCVERLSKDDNDIFNTLQILGSFYPDIVFESISCRGKRSAPGGDLPVQLNNMAIEIISEPSVEAVALLKLSENGFDRNHSNNHSLAGRSAGNESFRSRSSSIDYSTEETRLRRLSVNCDDTDLEDTQIIDKLGEAVTEKDFVSSFADPNVAEELDIIDGIYHKPHHESEDVGNSLLVALHSDENDKQ